MTGRRGAGGASGPARPPLAPAFAVYERGADGRFAAHSIQVLDLARDAISSMTLFVEPRLVPGFGLPPVLPDVARDE